VRCIYERLGWPDFDGGGMREAIVAALPDHRAFVSNSHRPLPPQLERLVDERWARYAREWGYRS